MRREFGWVLIGAVVASARTASAQTESPPGGAPPAPTVDPNAPAETAPAAPSVPVEPAPLPPEPVAPEAPPTPPPSVGAAGTAPAAAFPSGESNGAAPPSARPSGDDWTQAPLPTRTGETPRPPRRSLEASEPAPSPLWVAPPAAPEADRGVDYGAPREKRDESWGLLGPVRIGPLIGIGLPNLVNFGGMLKITRYFGAGVNIGLIPKLKLATYGDATVSYQEYDLYGRIFPFGGGFFIGAGVGYARAEGTFEKSMDISSYAQQYPQLNLPTSLSSDSKGSVESMVLTPQLGYFQIFRSGFCVGVDIGAQIPIARSEMDLETHVTSGVATQEVPQQVVDRYIGPGQKEVHDTLESIARTPIPTFNFRIGWML